VPARLACRRLAWMHAGERSEPGTRAGGSSLVAESWKAAQEMTERPRAGPSQWGGRDHEERAHGTAARTNVPRDVNAWLHARREGT
jgi:hypothetical protein